MNTKNIKIGLSLMLGAVVGLSSCNKEPDDSNLYTFTGQTIESYLEADSSLTCFTQIVKRAGYDREMATYGQYTCYAPSNEGVMEYIDSLYNDETDLDENGNLNHHGMTANSIDAMPEELCKEIVKYHLTNMLVDYNTLANSEGKDVSTFIGQSFRSQAYNDGKVRINEVATISGDNDKRDIELINGYVHHIDKVIPRNTKLIFEIMEKQTQFSIFFEALQKTGLIDSLAVTQKDATYSLDNNTGRPGSSWASTQFYVPAECKIKFTIFAEDDNVLNENGITDFESLKRKCVEWYGGAAEWYTNPDGAQISTDDDYTNRYNVVNMFVAYHILKAGMSTSKLLYIRDNSNENWNYAFGGEPFDYYETMLPHTMMKIWQPLYQNTGASTNIWINRWRMHNTLTDEIGTFGSDDTHQIMETGARIDVAHSNIQSLNGYIHSISKPLVYDKTVRDGVLHERLRIDMGTMLYELINNDIRFATGGEIGARNLNGAAGDQTRLPLDYFDNLISYTSKTRLSWYTTGAWRAWEADQFAGWGENDFAFRLPPVPSGNYEIRIIYPPMANSGLQQYYIGTSKDPSSMQPLGIPIDARYPNSGIEADRLATGYLLSSEFDDYGVASDLVMRNHGYMRAPASFSRGTYNQVKTRVTDPAKLIETISNCCRYEEGYGTSMMRKILGTVTIDQSKDYWIRIKNLLQNYDQLGFSIDFIELVPIDIVNSQDYTEDWY